MKISKLILFSGFLVTVMTSIVHAQFFEVCKTGCVDELIVVPGAMLAAIPFEAPIDA